MAWVTASENSLSMLAGLLDVAAAEPILENETRNARGLGGDVRKAAGPDE